jgi:hypothetical protein
MRGLLRTVFLVTTHHIKMQISSPCIVSAIEVCDFGQDRPGEFGKRMEPYAVDDDGKSLQKIRIVRTHMSAKDDHGRSSHKLQGQEEQP